MKYPWMPLFWGDFLANTMHLSAQEAGAYLFLIAHAWEHDGEIPADWIRLARIAHVRQNHWKRAWKSLEQFFEPLERESLIKGYLHKRVLIELHRLGQISNNRKAAALQMHARKGANAYASAHASTSTSNIESFLGKQEEGSTVQMHGNQSPSLELQLAQKRHLGISPDKGMDYRAPPAKKSENVLTPLPDRQPARKKAGE
jgi:uncharacterized protein YdaU (DUF1376 family)